jgi:cellulose synthase/poly-beta-1,6-N-acetylglucosamine synthase-like glycosyltransferase
MILATILIYLSIAYFMCQFALSRRRRPDVLPAPEDLFFVFVVPCLNEEHVICATLDGLLALPGENYGILVVDDGSDDLTAELVRPYEGPRVELLRRRLPEAKHGKGAVLNAAYRHLRASTLIADRRRDRVIVAIVDADGRIDHDALSAVGGYFRDPRTGAVQLSVEIRNAPDNFLARLQDMEFGTFTEIFQRAREWIGSVGLGGNGQFVRLTALESLGESPWTDCLTEDLDLGIRLLLAGWTNNYCATACVNQQGVTTMRRWLRQRSRWFQGHMQCWRLIPRIVRSPLPVKTRLDLTWYLVWPTSILLIPIASALIMASIVVLAVISPQTLLADHGLRLVAMYLFSAGGASISAFVYWLQGRASLPKAILLAHAFELYSNLWLVAAWIALWRLARGKRKWDKTARVLETPRVPYVEPRSTG